MNENTAQWKLWHSETVMNKGTMMQVYCIYMCMILRCSACAFIWVLAFQKFCKTRPEHNANITTLSIPKFTFELDIGDQSMSHCPWSNIGDQSISYRGLMNFAMLSSAILVICPRFLEKMFIQQRRCQTIQLQVPPIQRLVTYVFTPHCTTDVKWMKMTRIM